MNIETLSVVNFRGFTNSQFKFHPRLNLVVGENGCGKSSLLAALKTSLSDFIRGLSGQGRPEDIQGKDVRFETQIIGDRIRFERIYPARVTITCNILDQKQTWSNQRLTEEGSIVTNMAEYSFGRNWTQNLNLGPPTDLPLVAFFGPFRNSKGSSASLGSAASQKISRMDAYQSWANAFVDQTQLESWVIGKTLEFLQLIAEGQSLNSGEKDELEIVNSAIEDAIPGATGLRYDLRHRSLMIQFDRSSPNLFVPFFDLSDGQQGIISLVAEIARRMCVLNPHLGGDVLKKTPGIIAIDELDVHLHPAWQRRVLRVLRNAFPSIQIVATSHSPQMIGGLQPDEVMIMQKGKVVHPQVTFGLDSSQVLEEVMSVESREPSVRDSLQRLYGVVETGDLKSAKKLLDDLRREAPDLPEYAQIEALIRRKETLGR